MIGSGYSGSPCLPRKNRPSGRCKVWLQLPYFLLTPRARKEPGFVDRRVGVAGTSLGRGFFTQKEHLAPAHLDCDASCAAAPPPNELFFSSLYGLRWWHEGGAEVKGKRFE
jgi:hypothetical protein